ncbi:MAG TPA: transcription elongation factor GreA, partial [Candidatus Agrococcus pullicola]|nr:transcription elongation factor GreA [Candidatus Agrococcus pullicola]
MTDTTETWLSQEAYDRLTAELEELTTTARADIAKRIEEAREEGD